MLTFDVGAAMPHCFFAGVENHTPRTLGITLEHLPSPLAEFPTIAQVEIGNLKQDPCGLGPVTGKNA